MINSERLTATFLELARINSPGRHEAVVADAISARLKALGFETRRDGVGQIIGGETGNIIAHRPGASPAPPIFLNAHMDTVQPTPDIKIVIEDGVIKTDGTTILGADDKAGVACILEALESSLEDGVVLPDIDVVITAAEEIGLLGARYFDPAEILARSGWVVDGGQPLGYIGAGAPSQNTMKIAITGKAAHAGTSPEHGISAIRVAAEAIASMPHGRIDPETTANVGVISGGQATNIVAPSCEVKAEARSQNLDSLERQTETMLSAFRKAGDRHGAIVDINVERVYEAFTVPGDSREVTIASESMANLGITPEPRRSGGGSDANYFNAKGIRCVILGCGYEDIHTTAERIAIEDMTTGARILDGVLRIAGR